ncbi:MAG: bifunctional 5,10-methylene-tetrahydrofolate dehydrogenase/5,10-methylene-tetrahydrofolate cyclohydrolase [Dehalococcoidia bacterium]|nr:bifunctional 5,10-methylene-tetrahydrofolate dehydrogenase/5,10-methylene-tetrahydrofolate cyclohydrolase [Dehalococcoidia bacterium]
MAEIIDGNAIAADIRGELKARSDSLRERGILPGLAFILVGDNPASASYVRGKNKDSAEVGIRGETIHLPAETTQEDLLAVIEGVNRDDDYHGMIVQLPLPAHLNPDSAIQAISPDKDADGLHPCNTGLLLQGRPRFRPATPWGVQELLVRSGHSPEGKRVVICGRSNLVGKPLAAILVQKVEGANATVVVCHTGSPSIAEETRQADIVVAAIGVPRYLTAAMVREGAVVIDVGINEVPDASRKSGKRLVGDVDYEAVAAKAAAITPVPGGVGPMTRAMLLANTIHATELAAP